MSNSLFDTPIGSSWSVSSDSSGFVNDVNTLAAQDYGNVGVNYGVPLFQIPDGTPDSTISVSPGCNNFLPSTGTEVPVPSDIQLNGSSDNPLVIYSTSLNKEWEFWRMAPTSNGYEACWGGEVSLSGTDGVFPSPYGLSASGISYGATTITEADVASGSINHALALLLPACDSGATAYPADRSDCGSDPGQPGEGTWFRFAPNATLPAGLPPLADMVFKAVQKYGMVVIDQSGAVQISAEEPSDWALQGHTGTDPLTAAADGWPEYSVINSLPWNDLQVVVPPQ